MEGKRLLRDDEKATTTKRVVWCSYLLAYLGRADIAESLSEKAVTEIVAVVLVYCLKSLLEKKDSFGAVGKKKATENVVRDL